MTRLDTKGSTICLIRFFGLFDFLSFRGFFLMIGFNYKSNYAPTAAMF